jgi:hypothetical protein
MEKPTVAIHNATTGETEYREMTDEEFADYEKINQEQIIQQQALQAEYEAAQAAKASALAKLSALGLTEEEAKAIAG